MHALTALLVGTLTPLPAGEDPSLFLAVPDNAYALVRVADPAALRERAELNHWITAYGSPGGESALEMLEGEYEALTGTEFDGLLGLARELQGESLLFFTGDVAGFLTQPPQDRSALAGILNGWLTEGSGPTLEVAGGQVRIAPWSTLGEGTMAPPAQFLAFFDHPLALGLYAGDSSEALLATLTESLTSLQGAGEVPALVEDFLAAGGGTTGGLEAYVDFTPLVPVAEENLRRAVEGFLPDPTGLLGLERGTWLFATADVFPGTRIDVQAHLHIPEGTLSASLADTFEPLPSTLPPDLPQGTWNLWALDWNLSRFYATARAGLVQDEEQGLETVDQGLALAEAVSGVDPMEEVVDQLAGLFALYHVLHDDDPAARPEDGFALLVGLVDGERFLDAFEAALGVGGLGIAPIELEGAETYLFDSELAVTSDATDFANIDFGLSILPKHFLGSLSGHTLVRGLRALGRAEGASLTSGSRLQAAFDENPGAFGFGYTELSHLRGVAAFEQGLPDPDENDPFESDLILAATRRADGIDLRIYTH